MSATSEPIAKKAMVDLAVAVGKHSGLLKGQQSLTEVLARSSTASDTTHAPSTALDESSADPLTIDSGGETTPKTDQQQALEEALAAELVLKSSLSHADDDEPTTAPGIICC